MSMGIILVTKCLNDLHPIHTTASETAAHDKCALLPEITKIQLVGRFPILAIHSPQDHILSFDLYALYPLEIDYERRNGPREMYLTNDRADGELCTCFSMALA